MQANIACEAMQAGKVLELQYDGFNRSVEVHAVGVSKAGNKMMCCWQIRGGSVSQEPAGWKFMKLSDVANATISDEKSQAPRQGYRRGDKRLVQIICEI